jgi:hypothetical protein
MLEARGQNENGAELCGKDADREKKLKWIFRSSYQDRKS